MNQTLTKKDEFAERERGEVCSYTLTLYSENKSQFNQELITLKNCLKEHAEEYSEEETKTEKAVISTRKSSNGNGNYSHRKNTLVITSKTIHFSVYSDTMNDVFDLIKIFKTRSKITVK